MTYERIDGATPAGGDYAEIWYMDDSRNIAEKDSATQCMIRECKNDGTLLMSTLAKMEMN